MAVCRTAPAIPGLLNIDSSDNPASLSTGVRVLVSEKRTLCLCSGLFLARVSVGFRVGFVWGENFHEGTACLDANVFIRTQQARIFQNLGSFLQN